jgi:hypothetical protein
MPRSVATVLAFAGTFLLGVAPRPARTEPAGALPADLPHTEEAHFGKHRYRIIGKVRLVLFWAGRDDIGGATMTTRRHGTTDSLTFLAGSDPQRAPRNLNEWGYQSEDTHPTGAEVFTLRTVNRGVDSPKPADSTPESERFGVSCASIGVEAVRTLQTKVSAPGTTYRMFERLLDQIATAPQWEEREIARPRGAVAGLLTALQQVIRTARWNPAGLATLQPVPYVYNNIVYDLSIRDIDWLGRTRIGSRTFDRLVRAELSIRNHTTGRITQFVVTFSPERTDPALPVQMLYQPNFWLRIELRLDDGADAPAGLGAIQAVQSRIRAICADAAR